MSAGCSRKPTVRKLEAAIMRQNARIQELENFARKSGSILENIWVSYSLVPEKEELAPLVEEYHALFPPVDDLVMEF